MSADGTVVLVAPPERPSPSGGDLANAALLAALRDRVAVRRLSPRAWGAATTSEAATYLVDTLCLPELAQRIGSSARADRVWLLAHLLPSQDPTATPQRRAAEGEVLPRLAGAVAFSAFMRDALAAGGVARPRIAVVEPGLPTWARPPAPRRRGPRLRALVVAHLSAPKGVAELLDALVRAVRPDDPFVLTIVGADVDPRYAARCRALAGEPALTGRVEVRGAVEHASLAREYVDADLLVSAAALETYGLALAEARAIGLPIAAIAGGNVPGHVSPETGVLAEDAAALAAAFLELARDRRRFDELATTARIAALVAPRPTWADAADHLLAAITRAP